MTRKRRIVSLFLALILICSITLLPALAAFKYTYYCYGLESYSFEVSTGNEKRKLTFEQSEGTIKYQNIASGNSSYDTYGQYLIYITCGKSVYDTYRFDFKQSLTVTLPKNKTYTVCIVPRSVESVFTTLLSKKILLKAWAYTVFNGSAYAEWETVPDLTVTSPVELKNWETADPAW